MKRREPPPLASWMLEHLTSGDRDDALAGDLLEVYRAGASDSWYCRQALAACAVSWSKSIRSRISLVVFALCWSILAPAWNVLIDRIENNAYSLGSTWRMDWPFSALSRFTAWIVLNAAFLGAGILVYLVSHKSLASVLRGKELRRALRVAAGLFVPVYFATFVLANLFAYPGPVIARHLLAPATEITDLGMWADVLRAPYLITLLCALWRAVALHRLSPGTLAAESLSAPASRFSALAFAARFDPFTIRRFFVLVVAAGLINASIAGFLLCQLPELHSPTLGALFGRAVNCVLIGALAGIAGSWLYWVNPSSPLRSRSPIPFSVFAIVCAAAWVWVPAMVIFSEQLSPAICFVAVIGAVLLASGLRTVTYSVLAPAPAAAAALNADPGELFAESLQRIPGEPHGYVTALCLYMAILALEARWNSTAAGLLAVATGLFAWNRTIPRSDAQHPGRASTRAWVRLALVLIPAVLVTVWALLDGIAYRHGLAEATSALAANGDGSGDDARKSHDNAASSGIGGYESVILWPYPEKKQIVPPILHPASLLAPGTTQPVVIRFDGAYWFLQPPSERPGPSAHQAHGTPLGVDIASNNPLPIVMKARQLLSAPIPLARCREIQVEIENRENHPGPISLALYLGDESLPGQHQFYLGQQPILTSEGGYFKVKRDPVPETLSFEVPETLSLPVSGSTRLRQFNEITVVVLPDILHQQAAPKIAIQDFRLFPR